MIIYHRNSEREIFKCDNWCCYSDTVIIDDAYQMYGVNPITSAPRPMPRPPYDAR